MAPQVIPLNVVVSEKMMINQQPERVISRGRVWHWDGNWWVDEGQPTDAQRDDLPWVG